FLGDGAHFNGSSSVTYTVPGHTRQDVYVAWLINPMWSKPLTLDADHYDLARETLISFWESRLASAATYSVPEQPVFDAERALLIQNSQLGWRYSAGNTYRQYSVPEVIDSAQVMGEYGFGQSERDVLRTFFWRHFKNMDWKWGEVLIGSARYYRLYHD